MRDKMAIFELSGGTRELKFEAFADEQTDFHPLIQKNPKIILPNELKGLSFSRA
jgi:hypothetical protein